MWARSDSTTSAPALPRASPVTPVTQGHLVKNGKVTEAQQSLRHLLLQSLLRCCAVAMHHRAEDRVSACNARRTQAPSSQHRMLEVTVGPKRSSDSTGPDAANCYGADTDVAGSSSACVYM